MYLKTLSALFLSFSLFLVACQHANDQGEKEFKKESIAGRWELKEAWRNMKKTELLTGTYYEFSSAGKMKTNLTKSTLEETYDFELHGQEITQLSNPPITYTIEAFQDSMLTLSMIINNFPFRLTLVKVDPAMNTESSGETGDPE